MSSVKTGSNGPDARAVTVKPKRGRPTKFNETDAAEILKRLAQAEPLTLICADPWLPCDDTVRAWAAKDPDFSRDLARARDAGWDKIAADTLTIADAPNKAVLPDGTVIENDPSRDKLRVWTRLELLRRWDPKRYGEVRKVQLEGSLATQSADNMLDVSKLSHEQREQLRFLIAQATSDAPLIEGVGREVEGSE